MKLLNEGRQYRAAEIRVDLVAAVVVIGLIAGALTLGWWQGRPKSFANPDGLDIRLVGIRPDASDDILDAQGRKIGTEFYDGEYSQWGSNVLQREFIFEFANAPEVTFAPHFEIRMPRFNHYQASGTLQTADLPGGRTRLAAAAALGTTVWKSSFFSSRTEPVEFANVTLRYYAGPAGRAEVRFAGPFQPNQKVVIDGAHELTPGTNILSDGITNARLGLVTTIGNHPGPVPLVVYDVDGNRHLVTVEGYSGGPRGSDLKGTVFNVPLERIATVAVERPREVTFYNIRVRYDDRPARSYPEYYDKMLAALEVKTPPYQWSGYHSFQSPEEALKVLEVARGPAIPAIANALRYQQPRFQITNAPPELRDRLRRTAHLWVKAPTPRVRAAGLSVGLRGGWAEFIPPALELLEGSRLAARDRHMRHGVSDALAEVAGQLSDDDLERIKNLLRREEDSPGYRSLLKCLDHKNPVARKALWVLARDDRPWIWFQALRLISTNEITALNTFPEEVQQRVILVHGKTGPVSDALVEAAYRQLPALLTPEIRARDSDTFTRCYAQLVKQVERPAASAAIVRYLRATPAPKHWDSQVQKMIKQLNAWHGTDFGNFGSDLKRQTDPKFKPEQWEQVFREIATWDDRQRAAVP